MFHSNPRPESEQTQHRTTHWPMMVASAVYLVLGLACLGQIHEALIMGIGYLALSVAYYLEHRA
jgi:hypothetical protein